MVSDSGISPQFFITDSLGKVLQDGDSTTQTSITVDATDGDHGSGLSLIEIWKGNPDSGGALINSDDADYPKNHTYSFSNLPNGDIYVRCFDQAGNDILHPRKFRNC